MVYIAVLGYGVVGSGVVEVIMKNAESIGHRAERKILVKKILDVRDFHDDPHKKLLTKNADDIFLDDSIKIVVETIGGVKIAYEFTKKALAMGKSVVTSNKELVATHGPELLKLAKDNGVSYLFEASVGGGIPIIRPLYQCLAANEINSISGILNGTTNYILTAMRKEGKDFGQALKEAQENGYAEADPTADIEGHDTCRKIAILSSIAYNTFIDYKSIYTEGISKLTLKDIKYAEEMECVIKLLAYSKKVGEKVFAMVAPEIISKSHPLANVEDVFNAILVDGNAIGDAMFYGRGAGKLPTASAVVADIIDIVKNIDSRTKQTWTENSNSQSINIDEIETKYFIRVENVVASTQTKEIVKNVFGEVNWITLNANTENDELAFISEKKNEHKLKEELEDLKNSGLGLKISSVIRVLS